MSGKRPIFLFGILIVIALGAAGAFFFSASSSRSIVISDVSSSTNPHLAGLTALSSTDLAATATGQTASTTYSIPVNVLADLSATSVEAYAVPFTLTPIDPATYDAKLLAIANIPNVTTKFKVTSTLANGLTTTTIEYRTAPVPSYWPVKSAPLPLAGALLPYHRIVAYYGNLYSTQMGVLGEYPEPQVLAMLASTSEMWAGADPSTPVIPALDYIAVAAQASAGPDGKYRLRMPASQIEQVLDMARSVNGLVFLDIQVGLSNVETEVPLLEPFLKLPQVELSLDPEFDMHDGAKPGTVIGTMDATDINFAANYLANLVTENNLPPKILVVHRFTDAMVTNTNEITPLPQVQIVMDMDGFGNPAKKITTYQEAIVDQPVQFTGFKLFYKNDARASSSHLMTPSEVLQLSPQPSYIQYQ